MAWISFLNKYIICSTWFLVGFFALEKTSLHADCCNKMDLGLAYVHIDVFAPEDTFAPGECRIKRLDMPAVRADATLMYDSGWCLKPFVLYGRKNDGKLFNYGVALGRCIPLCGILVLTPLSGVSYTDLTTMINTPLGEKEEIFHALAPYVGLEAILKITSKLRVCGTVQYAWSHPDTEIRGLLHSKSDTEGANYALLLEYDLYDSCSINVGAAYNESLAKDKHGIRGKGVKVGIAYWY